MAVKGSTKGNQFTAVSGVLNRCVKVVKEWPSARVALPLTPGAEVSAQDEHTPTQMAIFYDERVLVMEEVPAERAISCSVSL